MTSTLYAHDIYNVDSNAVFYVYGENITYIHIYDVRENIYVIQSADIIVRVTIIICVFILQRFGNCAHFP